MSNGAVNTRKPRIPGLGGYEAEARETMKLRPEEVVRRWLDLQAVPEGSVKTSIDYTIRQVEDQIMEFDDVYGVKLLDAYLDSDNALARSHAPELLEVLPFVDREDLALAGFQRLANDQSVLVLQEVIQHLSTYLERNPEHYALTLLWTLTPIAQKVRLALNLEPTWIDRLEPCLDFSIGS
jgi:hypothetical protein